MHDPSENTQAAHAEGVAQLTLVGGEYRDAPTERAYLAAHSEETFRHARLLLIASIILNSLFFISDWRFAGTPHFWVAIPARALVVAAALLCLRLIYRFRGPAALQRVMIGWMAVTAAGVTALVTSHSDIALFVTIILPSIYYMTVPVSYRWTLLSGIGCSFAMLLGYAAGHEAPTAGFGLALAMVTLNSALAILVSRSNRLGRLAWFATRSERRAKDELAASQSMLEKMFAACPVPILVARAEDQQIVKFNDSWLNHVGLAPGDKIPAMSRAFIAHDADYDIILEMLARNGSIEDFEVETRRTDGTIRTVILRANMLDSPSGTMVISSCIDITDRKAAELSLERLASTDMLTGLPNRLSFFTTAHAEMTRASRTGALLSLLMIDLDNFKRINDDFGHHAGDQVLRAFAATCRGVLAGKDIIGRLGGEEFAILLPHADRAQALALAERIREAVAEMRLGGIYAALRVTVSIGVASVGAGETNLDAALGRADTALYAAKRDGRNCVASAPDALKGLPGALMASG